MTKETRVGLFVGLVIVIVFGMILTEFKGTDAPFESIAAVQPVVDTEYYKTANPPQADLAFGPSPKEAEHAVHLASVDVEPPATESIRIRVLPPTRVKNTAPVAAVIRRNIDEENVEPQISKTPQPVRLDAPSERQEVQIQLTQHETAAPVQPVAPVQLVSPVPPAQTVAGRTYRVEEGDTLSRIAAKVYGPDKRHLYKQIYEANRGQLSDASNIHVGQMLTIPGAGGASAPAGAPAAQAPDRASQVDMDGLRQFAQQPRAVERRVYVVQSGDSLTRIARKMLNDDSRNAVDRLFEANRDKLRNRDSITEGMKLRIPS